MTSFLFYLIIFVVVSVIFTYFLKKYYHAKTYLIFSIVKSKKLAEKFAKLNFSSLWDVLGDFGVYLGFGSLGVFYIRKEKNKLISCLYVLLLFAAFFGLLYFLAGKTFLYSFFGSLIFAAFGFSGIVVYLLIAQTIMLFQLFLEGQSKCVGIAPVLPGVKIPKVPLTIPFFEGWIALIIGMLIHEFSHAVLMKKAKVKIGAFGPLLLGFLPIGAFVEPDEKKLKSIELKKKLRIYAAGPAMNIVFAILIFIAYIIFGITTAGYASDISQQHGAVYITAVDEYGGLCGEGGLSGNYGLVDINTKILAVNDVNVYSTMSFKTQNDLALKNGDRNIALNLEKDSNIYDTTLSFNDKNYLGISLEQQYDKETPFRFSVISFIASLLYWLFLLNLLIGIFNFLPVIPFDGGAMAMTLYSPLAFFVKKEKREKVVMTFFIVLIVILLILNLLPIFG